METWLDNKDIERIFKVVEGQLPEAFASFDELKEFERFIDDVIKDKALVKVTH